jgi:hypothetical protein
LCVNALAVIGPMPGSVVSRFTIGSAAIKRSHCRRGKKVAMVALARRLARTLFAMWRNQAEYQPERIRTRRPPLVPERRADAATAATV